jgi:SAM-dependent methyltransferase
MNTADITDPDIYSRTPESVQNGIPVFSGKDLYVENYEKIANDHVSQITATQENPFMEEALWVSLEASTRAYIQKHVSQGSRILDVGVGLGRLLEPLTEYKRYGVDISLDYLAIAKRRGIEVAMAKIEDLPYQAGFFDAIVVCDVLEHVFDLNYCCEKILACLRPGGVLIVRVPFKEDLDVYLREDLPYDFIHLRSFDEAGLRLHFQKVFGLQFVEASPTTPYLQGTPRLKLRLLPEKSRSKLAQLSTGRPELMPVAGALQVSEEAFQAWIYDLKGNSNALFKDISDDLILGIELNAVFVKPYSELDSRRALRAVNIETPLNPQDSPDRAFIELGNDFLKFKHSENEQLNKVNNDLVRVERLVESRFNHTDALIGSLKEQLESKVPVPLHKRLAQRLKQFFNFS